MLCCAGGIVYGLPVQSNFQGEQDGVALGVSPLLPVD